MRNVLVGLALVALSGCGLLGPKSSGVLVSDLTLAATCVGEVQSAAPACIAEVPACVSLGKTVGGVHK